MEGPFYHINILNRLSRELMQPGEHLETENPNTFWLNRMGLTEEEPEKVREELWERVRSHLTFSRTLPSRQKCLFAAETIEAAKDWFDDIGGNQRTSFLRKKLQSLVAGGELKPPSEIIDRFGQVQIVELKTTGKVHIADTNLFEGSADTSEERAIQYWEGFRTSTPRTEVLIEGSFTVTRIVEIFPIPTDP